MSPFFLNGESACPQFADVVSDSLVADFQQVLQLFLRVAPLCQQLRQLLQAHFAVFQLDVDAETVVVNQIPVIKF